MHALQVHIYFSAHIQFNMQTLFFVSRLVVSLCACVSHLFLKGHRFLYFTTLSIPPVSSVFFPHYSLANLCALPLSSFSGSDAREQEVIDALLIFTHHLCCLVALAANNEYFLHQRQGAIAFASFRDDCMILMFCWPKRRRQRERAEWESIHAQIYRYRHEECEISQGARHSMCPEEMHASHQRRKSPYSSLFSTVHVLLAFLASCLLTCLPPTAPMLSTPSWQHITSLQPSSQSIQFTVSLIEFSIIVHTTLLLILVSIPFTLPPFFWIFSLSFLAFFSFFLLLVHWVPSIHSRCLHSLHTPHHHRVCSSLSGFSTPSHYSILPIRSCPLATYCHFLAFEALLLPTSFR